jgi:hypothetical protein
VNALKSGRLRLLGPAEPENLTATSPSPDLGDTLIDRCTRNHSHEKELSTAVLFFRIVASLLHVIALSAGCIAADSADQPATANQPRELNVRDFGATGDGVARPVATWVSSRRFANLREIQKRYPFVDNLAWTEDEVAFESAKLALPPSGGTIHFPAGHYTAGRHGWRIWRDNVRLTGAGAEHSILATTPEVAEGLVLAPYRHVGWQTGAAHEMAFLPSSGARGESSLQLASSSLAVELKPGDLVFIRNGANRYDQDYGEFNEVTAITAERRLELKYPLARDYRWDRFNWAGEISEAFAVPAAGKSVTVKIKSGEGYAAPSKGATVSVGENLFDVRSAEGTKLVLVNRGQANPPSGTVIPAGTRIGKSRAVIKLTRTVRNFRCEGLQVIGRRKVVNLSNSYDATFVDCIFKRDGRGGKFSGGLTIDGDGGRFARFERCAVIAEPAAGMQFARSFGSVVFSQCRFTDANVAFTEFAFDCTVTDCDFDVTGTKQLNNVIIAGKSCGDLRFFENRIRATGVATIFDTYSDIHSQKHGSEGDIIVRDTKIETENKVRVFTFPKAAHVKLERNTISTPQPR